MERYSNLFMTIGRSSPRHQNLALLYSNSNRLRRYLAEYFIVVVEICQQFLNFSQKSTLGQLTSSLIDAQLRRAEEKLDAWALYIKEEVNFLNTKTLIDDFHEVSRMGALIDMGYHSRIHQKNLNRRLKWLDACTTYDHEISWKQARKLGKATIFATSEEYREWKSCQRSSRLVLSGKLGSGKTVVTANIVDDLNLSCQATVCYFFCRHDTMYSCQARTIMGSLCRQLLQCHINDDTMDRFLGEHVPSMSYDDVVALVKAILSLKRRIYFVLDGPDECESFEIRQVTRTLQGLQVDENSIIHLLVSLRSQADDAQTEYRGVCPDAVFGLPEDNPDIASFIDSELCERIEAGELILGDPSLVLEIRDALLDGAQGM